jgi:O-antigen/teichoic acid export membrane protein
MTKSLTDKTISGINWSFLNTYGTAVVNIIVGIVLARLIPPQEFGLLGMTVIFTGLADLFVSLGMGPSIVRLKELSEAHIRVGATLTIYASILIYIVFWFASPSIASFFNEERLIWILRALSVLFILKGLTTVSASLLTRELDFKTILIVQISSFTFGYAVISVILAFLGFGVWSLVIGRLLSGIISTVLYLIKSPIPLKPLIRKKEFKDLAGFGSGVSLSRILQYTSSNIDYLIIGKFLTPYKLGLYTRAFNLMTLPVDQISSSIYNVLFPSFSIVQAETDRLRTAYLRTVKTVSFFLLPVLAGMAVSAEYIIKGLYGLQWAGSINVFRILCIGGILRATLSYSGAIAIATGKIFVEVSQQIVYLIILAGCAFYLVRFGIEGVGIAVVLALVWMFIAQSWLAIKIIKTNWSEYFKAMVPGFVNLLVIIALNLFIIFATESIMPNSKYEIKLLITIVLNTIVFLSAIVFIPESIKGDTFNWLLEKYQRFIPAKFKKFYYRFN